MTDPTDKWRQAFADLRVSLLATGTLDLRALSDLRGDTDPPDTRSWIQQQGLRALMVDDGTHEVYPAFQFTATGELRAELAPHIATLQDAGVSPWRAWAWLVEPASLLSWEVPLEVLATNPARGARAVERLAAKVRSEAV